MKYIKIFENYNENFYWNEDVDSYEEWAISEYWTNRDCFSIYEKDQILKVVDCNMEKESSGVYKSNYIIIEDFYSSLYKKTYNSGYGFKNAHIYKLLDDYYYLIFERLEFNPNPENFLRNEFIYKCDQIEGLIQCIKDNLLI